MQAKPVGHILLWALISLAFRTFSQSADTIANKIALYHSKVSTPTLFVHFDKTVYTSNEQVWFTGYLLKTDAHVNEHTLLLISLVRNADRKVITSAKFVMRGGLSSGTMVLPDSIPAGHYTLTAYTNLLENGVPLDLFEQPVTIKTADLAIARPNLTQKTQPAASHGYSVKFYPEGGNMVANLMGRVGFEIKDKYGAPLSKKGVLFRDGSAIDTIETDNYGMGSFFLTPVQHGGYSFKMLEKGLNDTTYFLPPVLPSGIAVTVSNAVSQDTLKVRVTGSQPGKITLMVHNYNEVFYLFPTNVGKSKLFKVPLQNVPKGLAAVTILNEQQQPLAERVFFAHYDAKQNEKLNITTDKAEYGKREKATLQLKLNDDRLRIAAVSIAVVQGNRVEELNKQDISSYFYLKHELVSLPFKNAYFGNSNDDKQYMDNVLLIKGWRRYKYSNAVNTTAKDTSRQFSALKFTGLVTKDNGKPLKNPVGVVLVADSAMHLVMADAAGKFVVKPNEITIGTFKRPYFLQQENTALSFNDPYVEQNKLMAKNASLELIRLYNVTSTEDFKLSSLEFTKQLKEVTIKSKNDQSIYGTGNFGSNECGDYVCMYNILNCRNHPPGTPGNHPPVQGQLYMGVAYSGCVAISPLKKIKVDPIYHWMEFYPLDSVAITDPTPEFLSTIYWKNLTPLESGKPIELSFYTGDIKGEFKVIVQGVGANDVVYGEHKFVVK